MKKHPTSSGLKWPFIVIGFLLLIQAAYLDNCRGPLMPLLNRLLDLKYEQTSWFLTAGYLAALFFMTLLMAMTRWASDKTLTLVVSVVAIAAVLFTPLVQGWRTLVVLAALIGFSISGFGSLCNLYVIRGTSEKYRARFLCGLHMMYGLGSMLGPAAVGLIAALEWPWYLSMVSVLPLCMGVVLYIYQKVPPEEKIDESLGKVTGFSSTEIFILLLFAIYVGGEVTVSMWMVPYLVEFQKLSVAEATPYASAFFIVIALSRGLCFLSMKPEHERVILWICLSLSGLMFALGRLGWLWALPLAGVLGPYFPLLFARMSRQFPIRIRQFTYALMAVIQMAVAFCHVLIGRLTDTLGIHVTYWIPFAFLLVALLLTLFYLWLESRRFQENVVF